MDYFLILNCSGNITSCCTDPGIATVMTVGRKIYSFIQLIVPLLLIIFTVIKLIGLINNPDDKKGIKPIINSFIAAIVIFFLPTILSAVLILLPEQIQLTACWESAATVDRITRASAYVSTTTEEEKKTIVGKGDEYEKGVPRPKPSSSESNDERSDESSDESSDIGDIADAEYLGGGMPIPLYYQQDYKDVILQSPNKTVSSSGCGFTSCSMVVSYLLNEKITPREFVSDWSRKHYYSGGMLWTLPQATMEHYGLESVEQTTSIDKVVQALRDNHPVMSSQGPGLFTSGGHLIVLRGITSDGKILVNDPNRNNAINKGYNDRKFSPSEINASNRMYFIFPQKK